MQRLVLLILIGFIANWYWRNLKRQRGAARAAGRDARGASLALPEPMVRCAHCDTYLPVSEATASQGRHFCGPNHAKAFAARVAQAGDGR
jgi:uncharacterized protein